MQGAFIYLNDQLAEVIVGRDTEGVGFVGVEVERGLGCGRDADNDLIEDAATRAADLDFDYLIVAESLLLGGLAANMEMTLADDDSC